MTASTTEIQSEWTDRFLTILTSIMSTAGGIRDTLNNLYCDWSHKPEDVDLARREFLHKQGSDKVRRFLEQCLTVDLHEQNQGIVWDMRGVRLSLYRTLANRLLHSRWGSEQTCNDVVQSLLDNGVISLVLQEIAQAIHRGNKYGSSSMYAKDAVKLLGASSKHPSSEVQAQLHDLITNLEVPFNAVLYYYIYFMKNGSATNCIPTPCDVITNCGEWMDMCRYDNECDNERFVFYLFPDAYCEIFDCLNEIDATQLFSFFKSRVVLDEQKCALIRGLERHCCHLEEILTKGNDREKDLVTEVLEGLCQLDCERCDNSNLKHVLVNTRKKSEIDLILLDPRRDSNTLRWIGERVPSLYSCIALGTKLDFTEHEIVGLLFPLLLSTWLDKQHGSSTEEGRTQKLLDALGSIPYIPYTEYKVAFSDWDDEAKPDPGPDTVDDEAERMDTDPEPDTNASSGSLEDSNPDVEDVIHDVHPVSPTSVQLIHHGVRELAMVEEPIDLSSPSVVNARSSPNDEQHVKFATTSNAAQLSDNMPGIATTSTDVAQYVNSGTTSNSAKLPGTLPISRPVGATSSPDFANNVNFNFLTTSDSILLSSTMPDKAINATDVANNGQSNSILLPSTMPDKAINATNVANNGQSDSIPLPSTMPDKEINATDVANNGEFVTTSNSAQLPCSMPTSRSVVARSSPNLAQHVNYVAISNSDQSPGAMQGIALTGTDAANIIHFTTAQLPSTSPVGARSFPNVANNVNFVTSPLAPLQTRPVAVHQVVVDNHLIQPSVHDHQMMHQHSSYNEDHQYSRSCVSEQHAIQQYDIIPNIITSSTSVLDDEETPPSGNGQHIIQIVPNENMIQILPNESGQNMQTFPCGDPASASCQMIGQVSSAPSKAMGDQQVHSQPADTTSQWGAHHLDGDQSDGAHSDGTQSEAHERARPETSSAKQVKMEVLAGLFHEHAEQSVTVTQFEAKLKRIVEDLPKRHMMTMSKFVNNLLRKLYGDKLTKMCAVSPKNGKQAIPRHELDAIIALTLERYPTDRKVNKTDTHATTKADVIMKIRLTLNNSDKKVKREEKLEKDASRNQH